MNKVLILREKYPKVGKQIFESFVDGDKTPTKKYLGYMLKMWVNKKGQSYSSNKLITLVQNFDNLLPYIENKDIYSVFYESFPNLINTLVSAEILKEEKTFNKLEHINVIYEDENVLFLLPKTYRGSTKYGYGTKWCTAMTTTDLYFKKYTNGGSLCYLIDKNNGKDKGYNKIAFYLENGQELEGNFSIWNESDLQTKSKVLFDKGWDETLIVQLVFKYRIFSLQLSIYKKTKDEVNKAIKSIENINLDELFINIQKLEKYYNEDHSLERNIINNFIETLKDRL